MVDDPQHRDIIKYLGDFWTAFITKFPFMRVPFTFPRVEEEEDSGPRQE